MTAELPAGHLETARRIECELDSLYFNRYFVKQQLGQKMLIGQHHRVLRNTLAEVVAGNITRLVINVPPGYGKTLITVIHAMTHGLALEPRARFMHLSYSDSLVRTNSSAARDIVLSEPYQSMWPRELRADAKAKNTWWTKEQGGIYAAPLMGQVTGFRAGQMIPGKFTGALIIDDPIKPADVTSETMRTAVNENYNLTVASRLALETVPVIVVMQRLHYDDLSGYLLRGGSGEKWHHLELPALIDNSVSYPDENTHGLPIAHGLPDGWLWPIKHNDEHLTALKAHKRKWLAQYQQRPPKFNAEGALWTEMLIDAARQHAKPWHRERTVIAIDPQGKKADESDDTGIVVCSKYRDKAYSVDADYTDNYSPSEWAKKAIWAHQKHDADAIVVEVNNGGDMCEEVLRLNKYKGRVIKVHATRGKDIRAEPIVALYELGEVRHNPDVDLTELETELLEWVPGESKESPNRLDAVVWGLTELAGPGLVAMAW